MLKYLTFFLLMSFLIFPILQVKGQSSGFKVMLDKYNWTSDMKYLKITTQNIGLILKITIWNDGSEPIDFTNSGSGNNILWINVRVDSTTDTGVYFFQQLQMNNLYLPPNETLTRFVNVEFLYGQPIGDYTAKINYSFGTYPSTGQPVEGSPFDYSIVDNDTFSQEIQQSRNVSSVIVNNWFPLNFSVFTLGDFAILGLPSISAGTLGSIAVYNIYMKRKGKTQKENNSKRSNKQRTRTSPKT